MQSILLNSMVLSRWGRHSTYMHRDAGEEGGREFSSKMPCTMSNLPDFPRRPFLYAHLCFYTKSMLYSNNETNRILPTYACVCWGEGAVMKETCVEIRHGYSAFS